MPAVLLYSAPKENYLDHISSCKDKFELLYPNFHNTIIRCFNGSIGEEVLRDSFLKIVLFHDLGKLTKRWQEKLGSGNKLPSHSTIGAVYLWKSLPEGIKEPISFAVAIHHTDRGLLGDNIERPDVQAILDGVADNSGNILWHDETKKLTEYYFPKEAETLTVNDLKNMARGLRLWAKGCGLLEQHQRRLQASLAHHILKLCDISAAVERKEYQKQNEQDYYGGWLMVESIKKYVDNISNHFRAQQLQRELDRWLNILKTKYEPQTIILFGSLASGHLKRWSDMDLIIIKETDKPFFERIKEILLFLKPQVGVDILVYTPEEFKYLCANRAFFKQEILEKGVKIFERRS